MGDSDGSSQSEKDGWDEKEQSSSSFQTAKLPFSTPPSHGMTSTSLPDESLLRVLKSVVGSPFYVAPEVLQARGYDGPKADVWSLGVILYAMLAGNLPFEQELSSCKRFRLFCKWVREQTVKGVRFWNDQTVEYPQWLFPAKFSMLAKGLIVAMLHPDPDKRLSVSEAMRHPLCASHLLTQASVANPVTTPASGVTFSLLPIAVAATASVANNTAVLQTPFLSDQIYSDTVSIPIASAIETTLNPVAVAVADGAGSLGKSQCPQSSDSDRYSLSMDVESESAPGYSSSRSSLGQPPNESCQPARSSSCEEQSTGMGELCPSPCREHDDLDDGMFFMEEETDCRRGQSLNVSNEDSQRNSDFASLSNVPQDRPIAPSANDWKVQRKKNQNLTFPTSLDTADNFRMDLDPEGCSAGDANSTGDRDRDRNAFSGSCRDLTRGASIGRGPCRSVMGDDVTSDIMGCGPAGEICIQSCRKHVPYIVSLLKLMSLLYYSTRLHLTESPSSALLYLSYSPQQMPLMEPPVAPLMSNSRSIDDLITAGEDDYSPFTPDDTPQPQTFDYTRLSRPASAAQSSGRSVRYAEQEQTSSPLLPIGGPSAALGAGMSSTHPPSFNDSVKRSTRFITAVPASEVLDKVESILEQVRLEHVQTPIGIIGKIAIYWAAYRIEVWGADTSGPPLCALQLYQMSSSAGMQADSVSPNRNYSPASSGTACSPAASHQSPFLVAGGRISPTFSFMSPSTLSSSSAMDSRRFSPSLVGAEGLNANGQQQLFLAEFVRGQLEIFAFKRFYQWVRQRLSQLVKRDYAFKLLDQQGSPM
jgi:serine/threonine protein kinase